MTDRIKLAEELEAAEGPSRELDRAIKELVGHDWDYRTDWDYWDAIKKEKASKPVARPYTSSIDAAMTLVPEGWALIGLCQLNDMSGQAAIRRLSDCRRAGSTAATPALALASAALKAGDG